MNRNSFFLLISIIFILLAAGCSSGSTETVPGEGQSGLTGLTREHQGSYSATFSVNFTGSKPWSYQLTTRKSGDLREESLHIEGVDPSQNPGDIRLVTDGTNTWMSGAGTDQECVQFPNNQGMDPTFILPETFVPFDEAAGLLEKVGEETVLGKSSLHYQASGAAIKDWQNASVQLWQAKENNALLGFTFRADGSDPFFGTGSGTITARYAVDKFDAETISPVEGCELSVPLPDSAEKFVRLPGLASFESGQGVDEISSFYQTALPQESWVENEPASQSEGVTVLSYHKDAEQVEIQIEEASAGGSKVKLLFIVE